jgi:hypothetical protein
VTPEDDSNKKMMKETVFINLQESEIFKLYLNQVRNHFRKRLNLDLDDKHNQTGDWAEALNMKYIGLSAKNKMNRSKSPNVITRLNDWGKDRDQRMKDIRETYINNYSFTPKINEVSKIMIELEDTSRLGDGQLGSSKR